MTGGRSVNRRALVGRRGEQAVADWYEAHGFRILERNWRCALGELDLVLWHQQASLLVFCEVKARTSEAFGSPFEAVGRTKLQRLRRLVGRFMAEARPPGVRPAEVRLDVAAVRPGPRGEAMVEVVEGAG